MAFQLTRPFIRCMRPPGECVAKSVGGTYDARLVTRCQSGLRDRPADQGAVRTRDTKDHN
jgi:hypothetical protein